MDRIAFMIGETFLYWTSIILTFGVATAVCFFWAFYLGKSGNALGAALTVPIAMILSLILARMAHWYCRADSYASFQAAMTDFTTGGYALMGVFAGCLLTAVLLRLLRVVKDLPQLLDSMCIAGSAGIAVGRLACLYSAADRGQIVQSLTRLPWVYPVTNAVSGAVEYRLATFMIQSIAAGIIFLLLAALLILGGKKLRSGTVTLLFLLLYCASQVVLDSTRYDSLHMRSNGFISIVQVLSAVAIVFSAGVFSLRMVKKRGLKWYCLLMWAVMLGLLGAAGYMEYHVQRHGDQAVFAYSVMSACLAGYIVLTLTAWLAGVLPTAKAELPEAAQTAGGEND